MKMKTIHLNIKILLVFTVLLLFSTSIRADTGYELWLRYNKITNSGLLTKYRQQLNAVSIFGESPTHEVIKKELRMAFSGMLDDEISFNNTFNASGSLIIGTPSSSELIRDLNVSEDLDDMADDGFMILSRVIDGKNAIVITSNTDLGLLYGAFRFISLLQRHASINDLDIRSAPRVKHRLLNHWDNLDRTVERGYAGFSIWNWHKLPDYIDQRYIDYARANASLGINGAAITNVNANALVLTESYLEKVAALADAFRPYGIKVYLTARFSAPSEIGGLETSDPLNPDVIQWWKDKADEIYSHIPDFGGFLVKANSEGQPGPQNYGRTHADGANLLADAVAPHGGIVMWRAFVYSNEEPEDRAKQAYNEFVPLDGTFRDNVLIQVKNGPIDFQPREPFHPLFGAMPETPLMMEFQITKEYLGFSTHLSYLAPLFKETLDADTYAKGEGSTVGKVIDGSLFNYEQTGIAGVSNIGTDINWTGSIFGQADWYAFGRLAWDHELSAEQIAREWIGMTFTADSELFSDAVTDMMMKSREAVVNYMTPLGLHHLMGWSHHYGPGPWIKDKHRADWTSVYYHRADGEGIGFNRTRTGSDAVSQYYPPVAEQFDNLESTPEEYLLWFHHVDWDYRMASGRTLWEEICLHYQQGVDQVADMLETWEGLESYVDEERYSLTHQYLEIQLNEANWWKNACIKYFQTFSQRPVPEEVELTDKSLDYYISLNPLFVPGN